MFLQIIFQIFVQIMQALDLKPNYVRAWSNMGISYANQVLYRPFQSANRIHIERDSTY